MKSLLLLLLMGSTLINDGWRFALGHAADPAKDFGHATEYFTYYAKANSIHNEGPYALRFNDSAFIDVTLPHDWAPSLPYAAEASHSHGYHCLGWRYPENSVGWYRRWISADSAMMASGVRLVFDGIFRDSRVWVNGFYVGREESGYTRQEYEIADYLLPGDSNLVCVRVDASVEEGWWYEGAGIYRNVWLETGAKTIRPAVAPWRYDGVKLRGVNLHQDHGGCGIAIPKGLWEYRLRKLQEIGVNAIRCSHNPVSEDLLDLCDSLGIYVIEETRLMGVSEPQLRVLQKMIERDRHHPCIIMWSVGNEEWGLEWTDRGERLARRMQEYAHQWDPLRPCCVATSSGPHIVRGTDIAGYNYLMQNDIEGLHQQYPERVAAGTEETTGCGTRGIYYTDRERGHMAALNREADVDGTLNRIERGWQFYHQRDWLLGLFYWTGFDYMGEPNPMEWPTVGSQFGLLDLCGFRKDEAYYLQSWWTDTPTLHILPHWNLSGHEGEAIDVWVYSNMDEVELRVNGKSLGRQTMPRDGHLAWQTIYQPGRVEAIGYKQGRRALRETVYTTGAANRVEVAKSHYEDVTVLDVTLLDSKNHFAATACDTLAVTIDGGRVIAVHNGDPACHDVRPMTGYENTLRMAAFNGHAQVVVQGELKNYSITLLQSGK